MVDALKAKVDREPETSPMQVLRPGYFECRRRIERLSKFQDLLRHNVGWTHEVSSARPLGELIGTVADDQRDRAIEQAISRLVVAVGRDLDTVGVSSAVSIMVDSDNVDEFVEGQRVRQDFDLIDDYFDIQRYGRRGNSDIFLATIRVLDQGIGAYEIIREHAKFDFVNPIAWCAWLLRMPVLVLQRAGVATGKEAGEKALRFVAWTVGLLLVPSLVLLLLRLGISIPWDIAIRIVRGL